MDAMRIECNSNYRSRNLNSAHHSWKPIKHVNNYHCIDHYIASICHMVIVYCHIEPVTWTSPIVV